MAVYQNFDPPTREQGQVAAWMFIVALSIAGFVCLCFALDGSPEHTHSRQESFGAAVIFWMAAIGVWGIKRGLEWFIES